MTAAHPDQVEAIVENICETVDRACLLLGPADHQSVLAGLRDRFAAAHDRQPAPSPFTIVGCIVVDASDEEG